MFYSIKLLKINGLPKGKPHFYSLEIRKLRWGISTMKEVVYLCR
ncbi:hypothetical protein BOVA604_255 [Bacteroides ovatus]|nr:hypothetical protein BOVA604_255 [Bacteroides ovatus]